MALSTTVRVRRISSSDGAQNKFFLTPSLVDFFFSASFVKFLFFPSP